MNLNVFRYPVQGGPLHVRGGGGGHESQETRTIRTRASLLTGSPEAHRQEGVRSSRDKVAVLERWRAGFTPGEQRGSGTGQGESFTSRDTNDTQEPSCIRRVPVCPTQNKYREKVPDVLVMSVNHPQHPNLRQGVFLYPFRIKGYGRFLWSKRLSQKVHISPTLLQHDSPPPESSPSPKASVCAFYRRL